MKETEPRTIAPHLITDTGVWRLTVEISDRAMNAWIRRNDDPTDPVYSLAQASWTGDDSLRNVENAVYDHPLVLDDFEADIIVNTPRFLFLPAEAAADTVAARKAFAMIYGEAADDDVFIDPIGEYACVYMLMPGLKPFLSRTFAGSRITCHISRLITHWLSVAPEGKAVFADIRPDAIDVAAVADGRLLTASRRGWTNVDDQMYHIANTVRAFGEGTRLDEVTLFTSGGDKDVAEMLAPYMAAVAPAPLPADDNIPLPALLCSYRKPIKK